MKKESMNLGIKIASYNTGLTRIRLFGCTLFEFAPHVEFRSKHIYSTIMAVNPDIICLQEVFSRRHLELISMSLLNTHPHRYAPRSLRPKLFGSGLALFSKFPILEFNLHWFKSQLFEEAVFAPRSYMTVTVDTGTQGLVEIINCHTTAGGSRHHPESSTADACRQLQIEEMVVFSSERDISVNHSLLVGDLNCGPEASIENYKYLLSKGFTDLVVRALEDAPAPITWDPQNSLNAFSPHKTSPPQRIDHIFAKSKSKFSAVDYKAFGIEPKVVVFPENYCTPSDHYGVMVAFKELK